MEDQTAVVDDSLKALIDADMASVDAPGTNSEEVATLHKYVRLCTRLDEEAERVKEQCALILKGIESRRKGLDFVYGPVARHVASDLIQRAGGKAKSVKTPYGTVGFRAQPAKLDVTDDAALMTYAKSLGLTSWVKVAETVAKGEVSEYFKNTGDIPPGCEVTPAQDRFYVKGPKVEAGTD